MTRIRVSGLGRLIEYHVWATLKLDDSMMIANFVIEYQAGEWLLAANLA